MKKTFIFGLLATALVLCFSSCSSEDDEPKPVESITLNATTAELTVGGEADQATTTLTATVLPENATNKEVIWTSSDNAVATVTAEGVVTAVGEGTADITATTKDGGKTATCTVTVVEALFIPEGAIKVTPKDDWYTMLKSAEPHDVFVFMPGEYVAYAIEDGGPVFKSISFANDANLKAAKSSNKPIFKGFNIKLNEGVSLDMENIVLDGTTADEKKHDDQAIILTAAGATDHIIVTGCEIKNFAKGVLFVNYASAIDFVDINNNYIHDIDCSGGDGFDFRNGAAKIFSFTNNSVVNVGTVGKRDLFRMDANGNKIVAEGTITITNNNFENVSNDPSKRILYIRLGNKFPITICNNVISNTNAYYTNQVTTKIAEVSNNDYFNAPYFTACEVANAQVDDTKTSVSIDPKYNENYLVTDKDLISKKIGNF